MNRLATLVLLATLVSAGSLMAAETTVNGRLYGHWSYDMTDGADGMNEFGLGRAYLTVNSKLSDFTSVRITTDLRESTIDDNGKLQTRYYVIIKYGYLDWTPAFANKVLKLRFGLQPTPYVDFQNKLWGRRYLAKTVGDMQKFLTTSDAGVSAHLALGEKGKYGSLALAVFNGTSYSDLGEENKQKDFNFFAQVNPFTGSEDLKKSALVAQYYKGTKNMTFDDTTLAGDYKNDIVSVGALLAYRGLLDIGADLNWHTEGQRVDTTRTTTEMKENGASFHGTIYLGELAKSVDALKTLNLFGRYDLFDPNTDGDNDAEKLLIVGVECCPTKGFKASVNIRSTSFDDDSTTEKQLFVNTLLKF